MNYSALLVHSVFTRFAGWLKKPHHSVTVLLMRPSLIVYSHRVFETIHRPLPSLLTAMNSDNIGLLKYGIA